MDYYAVESLGDSVTWFVPKGLGSWFKKCGVTKVVELDWWQSATYVKSKSGNTSHVRLENEEGEGKEKEKEETSSEEDGDVVEIKVVGTPAQHWSLRSGFDRCTSLWGSFAVIGKYNRVWFAGDTGYCSAFKEIGRQLGPFTLG